MIVHSSICIPSLVDSLLSFMTRYRGSQVTERLNRPASPRATVQGLMS